MSVKKIQISSPHWTFDQVVDDVTISAFQSWMLDPVIAASMGRRRLNFTDQEIRAVEASHDNQTSWLFFMRTKAGGSPVGYVSIKVQSHNGTAHVDMISGDRDYHPLSTQLASLAVLGDWLFSILKIRKMVFHIRADNTMSRHILDKWATLEGRYREEFMLPNGKAIDHLRYAILASEWPDTLERLGQQDLKPRLRRKPGSKDRNAFRV